MAKLHFWWKHPLYDIISPRPSGDFGNLIFAPKGWSYPTQCRVATFEDADSPFHITTLILRGNSESDNIPSPRADAIKELLAQKYSRDALIYEYARILPKIIIDVVPYIPSWQNIDESPRRNPLGNPNAPATIFKNRALYLKIPADSKKDRMVHLASAIAITLDDVVEEVVNIIYEITRPAIMAPGCETHVAWHPDDAILDLIQRHMPAIVKHAVHKIAYSKITDALMHEGFSPPFSPDMMLQIPVLKSNKYFSLFSQELPENAQNIRIMTFPDLMRKASTERIVNGTIVLLRSPPSYPEMPPPKSLAPQQPNPKQPKAPDNS